MKRAACLAVLALIACGPPPPDPKPDGGGKDGGTDGGMKDGGSGLPTTCLSNNRWTQGNVGAEGMNPGLACRSCHLGQNFEGQNPNGDVNAAYAMFFMGTAYGDFNEANLCNAHQVPAGAVIEILDNAGVLKLTLAIDPSGNFRSTSTTPGFALPYRARIRANGQVRPMGDAQMNGDCNTCHTEQGREGAPGRIVWP